MKRLLICIFSLYVMSLNVYGINKINKVTNQEILNLDISGSTYDKYKDMKQISNEFVTYITFDKTYNELEDVVYVFEMEFPIISKNLEYQYELSCLRNGVIRIEVYMGDGKELSILNMEKPNEIIYLNKKMNISFLPKEVMEHLENIEKMIKIIKEFAKENNIELGF